jgi:crossover junction endodeoxyribonuclease RuvC
MELHEGLEEVLRRHRPDLVAVEDLYAHYRHPRTAIKMGHARGVVLLAAAQCGVEVISIPATTIKKTLTGNGHASKVQMQRAIQATFGLGGPPPSADVADAIAAAWCAVLQRSGRRGSVAAMPAGSEMT